MKNLTKILAGITAIAILSTSAEAGNKGNKHSSITSSTALHMGGGKHGGKAILKAISQISTITTAQLTSIQTILSDERTAMQTLHTERVSNSPISGFISTAGLNRENFLTAEAEFSTKMATIKADTIASILATLLPEQITELITLLQSAEVSLATTTTESNTTTSN